MLYTVSLKTLKSINNMANNCSHISGVQDREYTGPHIAISDGFHVVCGRWVVEAHAFPHRLYQLLQFSVLCHVSDTCGSS